MSVSVINEPKDIKTLLINKIPIRQTIHITIQISIYKTIIIKTYINKLHIKIDGYVI